MSGFNGAVESGALHGYDVVNNLTSTSTTTPLSANMGKVLNETITQSKAQAYDITETYSHNGPYNANETFALPNFNSLKNNDLIVIGGRRWGYCASITIRKAMITAGVTSNIILRGATGSDVVNDVINLNISTTGVVTITSVTNPFFPEVYYIKAQ